MLNSRAFYNSRPDGFGVLEVVGNEEPESPRQFVPLRRTDLAGDTYGPLASLTLTQTFALPVQPGGAPIEALYRFPLPGDAAVTGVRVRFGDADVRTALKERQAAQAEYDEAKQTGRQAVLLTRESPDVFTLAVAGIKPGEDVLVTTEYVQLARPEGGGWSLRIPLTTAPRYVRSDELTSRHAAGQPLALLRDPGHRFALNLTVRGADRIASPTHPLQVDGERVRLKDGEVVPDRDCVITWRPAAEKDRPELRVWVQPDPATGAAYFLALCTPPATPHARAGIPREVVLLVDHSGSMQGPKWEAADWAVERFLSGLAERDSFALGLFHSTTRWLAPQTRPAKPEAVKEAVGFLKKHKDAGGTELGVALELALDLPRVDAPSRHVLVITDAEVSDAGRLLRLADQESGRADRRRISVLCIDAAPNAGLASELAIRGGGVSRFLTSDPAEDDVTTALDEVLADWSAPVFAGLTLEVDRPGAEAAGRDVAVIAGGKPASGIDLGDLPAGRPAWAVGRVPQANGPLAFRLRTAGSDVLAECRVEPGADAAAGLKALFGADRIRRLEYLMTSGLSGDELRSELHRLGYDAPPTAAKVYAENTREDATKVVRPLLVRESLAAGLPSSETAFVAVRTEAGQKIGESVVVANALPSGWSEQFVGGRGAMTMMTACLQAPAPGSAPVRAKFRKAASPPPPAALGDAVESVDSYLMEFEDEEFDDADADDDATDFDPLERSAGTVAPREKAKSAAPGSARGSRKKKAPAPPEVRICVTVGQHPTGDGAVLFDSAAEPGRVPDVCQLTAIAVTFPDRSITADSLDPGPVLLVFVGDLTSPRARVRLADVLRQGGRRPLNVRKAAGQVVRIVVEDPDGRWTGGIPAMEVVLGWKT
jgi:Ca-activated chloride channel family protein